MPERRGRPSRLDCAGRPGRPWMPRPRWPPNAGADWRACHGERAARAQRPCPPIHIITHPGACGKAPVRVQPSRSLRTRSCDDRACGGDRRRRPDGADAGGRAGVGGRSTSPSSSGAPARTSPARAQAVCTHAPSRCSISAGSPIGSSRRDRWRRSRRSPGSRLDISDFPTRHHYGLGLWQNHIERILAGWVAELAVPIYRGREVTGFAQDDTGVDVDAVRRPVAAGGVSRRVRRRTQPDPQGSRHRVPRVGSDDEQPDRRGRDGRGAGMGHPPRRPRHPCLRQGGVRDPRRRGGLRGQGTGTGHGDRGARRTHERTHPARSQRGAHRRIRDRLRDPQSHLDLQVHRHDPAGRGLPRRDGSCWPATPRTCMPRTVDRASTPVCRMR